MMYRNWLFLSACALLTACGGGSGGSSNNSVTPTNPTTPEQTGSVTVALTDSPMSGVTAVELQLNELVMTDASGVEHRYSLGDMRFNLMDYQGSDSINVVDGLSIPVGDYHDVYMTVVQGDGNNGCYVEDGQGIHALQVQDDELPLMDFSVAADQQYSFTMEVGLYMGLNHDSNYNYSLSHEGSWSVNNMSMGHLMGNVDPQWIASCESTNAALTPTSGMFSHMAYLYPDTVTSLAQMGDVYAAPTDGRVAPVAVAPMQEDSAGNWYFAMGYLPAGTYRVGYSCLGDLDNPTTDDTTNGSFTMFENAGSVTIDPGTTGGTQTVMQCGMVSGGHYGMMGNGG